MQIVPDDRLAKIATVTSEDVAEYLHKKVPNNSCPCCSSMSHRIMTDETQITGLVQMGKDGAFALPPQYLPVAPIECIDCGYIRMFSLIPITNWKLSGKQ